MTVFYSFPLIDSCALQKVKFLTQRLNGNLTLTLLLGVCMEADL